MSSSSGGRPQKVRDSELIRAIDNHSDPAVTADELSNELDVAARTVRRRLREGPVETGDVVKKSVGNSHAYFLPDKEGTIELDSEAVPDGGLIQDIEEKQEKYEQWERRAGVFQLILILSASVFSIAFLAFVLTGTNQSSIFLQIAAAGAIGIVVSTVGLIPCLAAWWVRRSDFMDRFGAIKTQLKEATVTE